MGQICLKKIISVILSFTLAAGLSVLAHASSKRIQPRTPPNIIYILADDLGYGELGSYGQAKILTPNIDQMAREGLRFTQHYAGSTVCAPSRSVLLTGMDTGRTPIRGNMKAISGDGQLPLAANVVTLGEILQEKGYVTGAVGKWGLGGAENEGHPNKQGFDFFYGYLDQRSAHNYYPPYIWKNSTRITLRNKPFPPKSDLKKKIITDDLYETYKGANYVPDLIHEQVMDFITDNKDNPFFLYYATTVPHAALQVPDEALEPYLNKFDEKPYLAQRGYYPHKYPRSAHAAMISRMDKQIGQMMSLLKELGLDENTLVIFTSDNGPTNAGGLDAKFFNAAGGLRGLKRDLYEGGIRIPMIARWPGKIRDGRTTDHISAFLDVMPTLADLTSATLPATSHGISFLPTLLGQHDQKEHDSLYWEFHEKGGAQAVRMGPWKGVRKNAHKNPDAPIALYNLTHDGGEKNNVAADHREVVTAINNIMNDRRQSNIDAWNFTKKPPSQPNILLLVAEDMSAHVGAFGDPVAQTPNIDKLAQRGVRFTNSYTVSGVCSPSRTALITGVHQISLGGQHHRVGRDDKYLAVPAIEVKAFPELLRKAGYYTYTGRKLDYQFAGKDDHSIFTIWDDQGDEAHWRNREEGKPFFGMINFMTTHESRIFRQSAKRPKVVSAGDIILPPYYPDTTIVREDIARHYNNIFRMDQQVADILQQLEEDGLADDTIVIWTTDHGDGLPRSKRELFDSGIKVPMIIHWPEKYRPADMTNGAEDSRMISFIDLAPTILQMAHADVPEFIQGQGFLDITDAEKRRYIFASRDRFDEQQDRVRAVRDNRYKYLRNYYPEKAAGRPLAFRLKQRIAREMLEMHKNGTLTAVQNRWYEPREAEELYDTKNDPHEINNLSNDPAYTHILNRMRAAFTAWQSRVRDYGSMSEKDMAQLFWPDGISPVTKAPTGQWNADKTVLTVKNTTTGASIGYHIEQGKWQIYHKPVTVTGKKNVTVKAIRYGWRQSNEVVF